MSEADDLEYACEKLETAVHCLAASVKDLKDRLADAMDEASFGAACLPDDLAERWEHLLKRFEAKPDEELMEKASELLHIYEQIVRADERMRSAAE